jgi:hypothetical protein
MGPRCRLDLLQRPGQIVYGEVRARRRSRRTRDPAYGDAAVLQRLSNEVWQRIADRQAKGRGGFVGEQLFAPARTDARPLSLVCSASPVLTLIR